MKIRYPGPGVPAERRDQDEYSSLYGLPLPVGVAIDVPEAVGEHLCASGLTEAVPEGAYIEPVPGGRVMTVGEAGAEFVESSPAEETNERPARAAAKKR